MRQLSALDAQFLHVESATTFGHVGAIVVLDPATAPGAQISLDDVRDLLEARLHLAGPLRQRLVQVPLGLGRPYWVDDPDFDIEFHLREVTLPEPGDDRQLAEQVARIHARPLDRTRPMWEMYLIHGVSGGRSAVYSKVHHAAIDGLSGAEILETILDTTPEAREVEPPDQPWQPARTPNRLELLEHGLQSLVREPQEIVRSLPRALPHLLDLPGAASIPGARAISELSAALLQRAAAAADGEPPRRTLSAPRTPLNGPITAHRRFAFGSVPLEDVKRVKDASGMTVNDVVMALCTSVLRRWLLDHDALPTVPIVAAVPVSIRTDDPEVEQGNELSVMFAQLPTHVADPAERLRLVQDALAEAKQHFEAVPATILQDLSALVPTALSGLAARAFFRMAAAPGPPVNLFVSNVPGPQLPLYVAGARVLGVYPVSAVSDLTGGLNITLFSYNGALDFGLIACRELVPDVWNLIGYLHDALEELLELTAVEA